MDKDNFPKGPWTKNLSKYPRNFREEHVLKFKDDNNEGMIKPHNLGYRIFKANKVQNALLHYDDNGNTYIKTKVHASMKRTIYTSGALINGDGEVIWGKCNCVGGILGRCKHVFAMLWQMLDYVRDEKQFIEDTACTSKAPEWGKGSPTLFEIKPLHEFKFLRHEPQKQNKKILRVLEKRANNLLVTKNTMVLDKTTLEEHAVQLKNNNLSFFYKVLASNNFTPLSLENPKQEDREDQPNLPLTIKWQQEFLEILNVYDLNKDMLKYCDISIDEAKTLEKETRTQSNCDKWYLERAKRLTSSKFKEIIRRKAPVNDLLIRRIWPNRTFQSATMKMGLINEEKAVEKYVLKNPHYKVFHCGLCVNPGVPFLATSPDRLVYDTETKLYHLLEIKTLVKGGLIQNFTIRECIERDLASYLQYDETKGISLKKGHDYFVQIQGQMAITGLQNCHLLVDSGTEIFVQIIKFDEELWLSTYLPPLTLFYFIHFEKSLDRSK